MLWLHEDCIVKEALRRFMSRDAGEDKERTAAAGDDSDGEASGTIQVGKTDEGNSKRHKKPLAARVASSAAGSDGQPSPKRKRLSHKSAPKSETLNDKLEAKIETKTKGVKRGEEEIEEITGKLLITDLRGGEPWVLKEDLKCPSCQELLTST